MAQLSKPKQRGKGGGRETAVEGRRRERGRVREGEAGERGRVREGEAGEREGEKE